MSYNYEDQCGSCVYFNFQGDNYKGYCSWYKAYYYPGDGCSHQKSRNASGGCYITTMVCDVLEYKDDCDALNTLRMFRDNILQKDETYKNLLVEYDYVGPQIAGLIKREYNKTHDKTLCRSCYDNMLVPTVNYIKVGQYDKAIKKYMLMVDILKDYFELPQNINQFIDGYDMTNGGHGKVITKSKIKK